MHRTLGLLVAAGLLCAGCEKDEDPGETISTIGGEDQDSGSMESAGIGGAGPAAGMVASGIGGASAGTAGSSGASGGAGGTGGSSVPTDGGVLTWFRTCGDPVCDRDAEVSTGGLPCTGDQLEGRSCAASSVHCDPGFGCGVRLVCTDEDPTAQPGGCPF